MSPADLSSEQTWTSLSDESVSSALRMGGCRLAGLIRFPLHVDSVVLELEISQRCRCSEITHVSLRTKYPNLPHSWLSSIRPSSLRHNSVMNMYGIILTVACLDMYNNCLLLSPSTELKSSTFLQGSEFIRSRMCGGEKSRSDPVQKHLHLLSFRTT